MTRKDIKSGRKYDEIVALDIILENYIKINITNDTLKNNFLLRR